MATLTFDLCWGACLWLTTHFPFPVEEGRKLVKIATLNFVQNRSIFMIALRHTKYLLQNPRVPPRIATFLFFEPLTRNVSQVESFSRWKRSRKGDQFTKSDDEQVINSPSVVFWAVKPTSRSARSLYLIKSFIGGKSESWRNCMNASRRFPHFHVWKVFFPPPFSIPQDACGVWI